MLFTGIDDPEEQIQLYLVSFASGEVDEEDLAFIRQEVQGTIGHRAEIDTALESVLKGWSVYRLAKVDLTIMRLALYEINYDESIPVTVSLNEAINLSKVYSQESAPAFINGVLGGLVTDPSDA